MVVELRTLMKFLLVVFLLAILLILLVVIMGLVWLLIDPILAIIVGVVGFSILLGVGLYFIFRWL